MSHAKKKGPWWLDLHTWMEWLGNDYGISRALMLGMIFGGLLFVLSTLIDNLAFFMFWWVVGTAPLWLPFALLRGAWFTWIEYIREEYIGRQKSVLLEVKIPRDIMKSPRAMELVFNQLFTNSGEVTALLRVWFGSVRPWTAWEITSFGGEIHFYTWCWAKYRNYIEASIYAQYPEVEIFEVEDYATRFVYDQNKHNCYVTDYDYDPRSDAYPIKSYIDYELDKDPKEELKVDPFATVLEVIGSIKPHEQIWVQLLVRAAGKNTGHHAIFLPEKTDTGWKKRVQEAVDEVKKDAMRDPTKSEHDEDAFFNAPRPTWKQQEQLRAIERHLGKVPFEFLGRGIYISEGPPDSVTITATRWLWKPFNSPSYFNQLRPKRGHNPFDWPWQDFRGLRWRIATRRWIDAYRQRSGFYTPYANNPIVVTPEMLATIYHYPSRTVAVPGLQRIPAKKAEPPPNLPR